MDPISSSIAPRTLNPQAPVPAQQKRDEQAINAPQPRVESPGANSPSRELQLQQRQVVEESGENKAAHLELRDAGKQSQPNKVLADTERRQLQDTFTKISTRLNALENDTAQSGSKTLDESGPALQSREQAEQVARQAQSRIRQDSSGALAAQANISPQTALTLFQ